MKRRDHLPEEKGNASISAHKRQKGKHRHITAPPLMAASHHDQGGDRRNTAPPEELSGVGQVGSLVLPSERKDNMSSLSKIMDEQLARQVGDQEVVSEMPLAQVDCRYLLCVYLVVV